MVRSVASDSGGSTLWSKTWDGVDYANTNTKARTYAGTALAWGGYYHWKARIELTDGTASLWSPYHTFRLNAAPASPKAMTPTGGIILSDTTPELQSTFSDPDEDQGDFGEQVYTELYDNANSILKWSQVNVVPVPVGPDDHVVSVSPTGMASMTTITGANATDIITRVDHQLADGQKVRFTALTGGAGLVINTDYFVRDRTADTFKLAATVGATAINFTTDISAATLVPQELGLEHTYKWRARYNDDFLLVGAWSAYQVFKVSAPPSVTETSDVAVTLATSTAASDIVTTVPSHLYADGNRVRFTALTGGAGLSVGVDYYVIATNLAATTFQVSATRGGTSVDFTTDITAGTVTRMIGPSTPVIESTPTLDWTFLSPGNKAQYSFQVRVFDKGPTGTNFGDEVLAYDSGVQISAVTQHDVPVGILLNTHDYRWEVTVKDTDQMAFTLT